MRVADFRLFVKCVTASIVCTLAGCMVGPDFHTPKGPAPQTYTYQPLPCHTNSIKAAKLGGRPQFFVNGLDMPGEWWRLFHSPEINQLILLGLRHNPDMVAARATLTQARANLMAQIGSSLWPQASATYNASRQRYLLTQLGQSGGASIFNLYNASVPVTYTFDLFGGARRNIEAYAALVDYQQYELDAAYISLTANIVTSAITIASLNEQIKATEVIIKSQKNILKILHQQLQLGGISGADVYLQETQVQQVIATLPPLQQNLAKAYHGLAVLIGQLPTDGSMPNINLNKLVLPSVIPTSLPSRLAQQRPDIRASAALLHQASANIGVATANMYPQITLSGSYGWQSLVQSNLFKPGNVLWNVAAGISQPLFNGGALVAQKHAAEAAYDYAAAQYQKTILLAFENVADSLLALQNDANALRAQKLAEIAAKKSFVITQSQYKFGSANYLALLQSEQQYQRSLVQRIQAQAARYTDTVALFQALGGGWWNV